MIEPEEVVEARQRLQDYQRDLWEHQRLERIAEGKRWADANIGHWFKVVISGQVSTD